jgi:hypothetical protein
VIKGTGEGTEQGSFGRDGGGRPGAGASPGGARPIGTDGRGLWVTFWKDPATKLWAAQSGRHAEREGVTSNPFVDGAFPQLLKGRGRHRQSRASPMTVTAISARCFSDKFLPSGLGRMLYFPGPNLYFWNPSKQSKVATPFDP